MEMKKNSVFVLTDKAIYKPSDKIQFRVLVLNADMKPYEAKKVQVYITDGASNRVKQFSDVALHRGVFSGELQLSDSPVMGNWTFQVKVDDDEEIKKEFIVAEYTLPNFEFSIDADQNVNLKDGKIRAMARAKYTFGKIAKGNATIRVDIESFGSWKTVCVKSLEVNGKQSVELDIKDDLGITSMMNDKEVVTFHATFTEILSGREQNSTK
jgi:CD109 antigen